MTITYGAWLAGIAAAYNIDVVDISTSETGTDYLAFFNPPSFQSIETNIVSLNIAKTEITP